MVSPWDAERSKPGSWNGEPDELPTELPTPEVPKLTSDADFPPLPDSPVEQVTSSVEQRTEWDRNWVDELKKKKENKSRSKSGSVPIALLAISLVVALVVFLGLRTIRVSISDNRSGEQATASDLQGDEPVTAGSDESEAASTTVAAPAGTGASGEPDWNELARSVVFFEVDGDCGWVGSGTLILDGSYVLTNWHVSGGGECPIRVGLTEDFATPPRDFYRAEVVVWDSQIDLAIVRLFDAAGSPLVPPGRQAIPFASGEARLGDEVRLIGYPVLREEFEDGARYTLTLTEGVVSGTEDFGTRSSYDPTDSRYYDYEVWGEYIKHTAEQNGGVSGGAAFNTRGELVAIPTAGRSADNPDNLPRLELMRSIRFAKELVERIK